MEANCTKLTERILQLTLEIIYLLTGEDNIVVKKTSGDGQNSIMVPLESLLIPERNNEQKILEVTKKIIELLSGKSENWRNLNIIIKEEIKEDEEEESVMKEHEYLGHKDLHKGITVKNEPAFTSPDGSSNGNPPERCPRPLYSQKSTEEDHTILQHNQEEKVIDIKTEIKEEEETYEIGNRPSMKEDEMLVIITKNESSLDGSSDSNKEDNGMPQYSSRDCEKSFIKRHELIIQQRTPTGERSFTCFECEKSFRKKSKLIEHLRIHTGEKPFSCSECGKAFTQKSLLNRHQRVHTGEKPFPCSDCGKCFTSKGNRDKHMRIHTGEKPYSCPKCGRCFSDKGNCAKHMKTHIGEKTLSCSECGECFTKKMTLIIHQSTHNT